MTTLSEAFNSIYQEGKWGSPLCSGPGSWHPPLVEAYIDCVKSFLKDQNLLKVAHAIDLGCGDFNIGSKLLSSLFRLKAIDIAPDIIRYCKTKFQGLPVEFTCGDARSIDLEDIDIVFIRQVLQHLSNSDIQQVLSNTGKSCRYLVVTEHIPAGNFIPNADIRSGNPSTRLARLSGVDIMQKPFRHTFKPIAELLSYYGFSGNIKTTAYANTFKTL